MGQTQETEVHGQVPATYGFGSCACGFCSWVWLFSQSSITVSDAFWMGFTTSYAISIC